MTYLFVYGTLLPGLAPAAVREVVDSLSIVGPATVRGRLYHLGAYPGLVLESGGEPVHGKLLRMRDDPGAWLRLDAYEGYDPADPERSLFRRVRTIAALDASNSVEAWVYVYNRPAVGDRVIESGRWEPSSATHIEGAEVSRPNRRPIIGVTLGTADGKPRYELPFDYASSIERAGGLPLAIPYRTDLALIPEIVDALDGVLFTGGDDLDPSLYGEVWHAKAEHIDPDRQRFELALIAEVERRRVPALGVCLGSQLMNVHRGGSLHQFLPDVDRPDAIDHRRLGDDTRRHVVRIEPGTILAKALGRAEVIANTRHKQAVNRVGKGLRVNARAPDGVVEGIEDPDLPLFLGVQWHPENISADPDHLTPFKLLVEKSAARSHR